MLVGACIGLSVVVVFLRDRFGWSASVPGTVVPVCVVIAIAAAWKWYRLDFDIAAAVERAIEGLSRASGFEASIRKSITIGVVVCVLFLVAMLFAPTHGSHSAARLALGVVVLIVIPCALMLFGWALKPGPTLVIDLDGLKHAAFGRIPWESIVGLHYSEFRFRDPGYTMRTLHIAVASPHRFAHRFPWIMRYLRPSLASAATRFGELQMSLNLLDEPHEVIIAAAYEFRGRVDAPFAEGWEPGMDSRVLAGLLAGLLAGQAAAPDASTYQTV
jgi:hypothetical protein